MINKLKRLRRSILNFLFKNKLFLLVKTIYSFENLILKKRGYKPYKFCVINIYEFLDIDLNSLVSELIPKKLPIYKPRFFAVSKDELQFHDGKSIYFLKIKNSIIIGEKPGFIKNKNFVYDLARNDFEKRYNLNFGELRNINNENALINSIDSKIIIQKGIVLTGFAPGNYYHFAIELLSRLSLLDMNKLYLDFPILIDKKIKDISQFNELLQSINIYNRDIIFIDKDCIYRVEELVYPSYVNWLPINVKDRRSKDWDYVLYDKPILNMRDIILSKYSSSANIHKGTITYISRKDLKNSRLSNENLVLDLMRELEIRIIYPEKLSLSEQIEIFYTSEVIVATSGAALTNIIFANKATTIVSIIPKVYNFYGYSNLAHICGIKTIFIDAKINNKESEISRETYEVDLNQIKQLLKEFRK